MLVCAPPPVWGNVLLCVLLYCHLTYCQLWRCWKCTMWMNWAYPGGAVLLPSIQYAFQGCVERRNAMVKGKLKAARRQYPGMEWPELLAMVQEQLNICPTRVLGGLPPTEVLFGQPNHGMSAPAAIGSDR